MPCTCSARTDVTPSWLCSTPSTIRNGSSTIDQPIAREEIGPHDDVRDAGFVLEREEDEPFRRPGPLAGDDHAGDAHAAALPRGAQIAGAQHAARRQLLAPQRHRMAADGQPGAGVVGHQPLGLGHRLQGTA